MPAGAIASLFGGMVGLAGQSMNNDANIALTRENNRAQRQLAKEADERNLRLWQLTNAYNSPLAQRKRLEQAGLNPGLMYGGIENTAGTPADSNVPTTSAGQRQFNAGPFVSAMNQAGSIIDANTGLNRQIKEQELRSITLENDNKQREQDDAHNESVLRQDNLRKKNAEIDNNIRLANNADSRAAEKHLKEMIEYDDKHNQAALDYDRSQYEYDEYKANRHYRDAIIAAQAALAQLNVKLAKQEFEENCKQIARIEGENYSLAEYQYFEDEIWPQFQKIKRSAGDPGKHLRAFVDPVYGSRVVSVYKNLKDMDSPQKLWLSIKQSDREALLNGVVRKKTRHKTFTSYYNSRDNTRYVNLGYSRYNTNSLGEGTNKYFQNKTHVKFGPVSADF